MRASDEAGIVISTAANHLLMRQLFPAFSYRWHRGVATWCGTLQPREGGTVYPARIKMKGRSRPRVTIPDLPLIPRPPHLYPDASLCLYCPRDGSWHPGLAIARTIVPWTAEWLYFFEAWQETGVWWGPEAPHAAGTAKQE